MKLKIIGLLVLSSTLSITPFSWNDYADLNRKNVALLLGGIVVCAYGICKARPALSHYLFNRAYIYLNSLAQRWLPKYFVKKDNPEVLSSDLSTSTTNPFPTLPRVELPDDKTNIDSVNKIQSQLDKAIDNYVTKWVENRIDNYMNNRLSIPIKPWISSPEQQSLKNIIDKLVIDLVKQQMINNFDDERARAIEAKNDEVEKILQSKSDASYYAQINLTDSRQPESLPEPTQKSLQESTADCSNTEKPLPACVVKLRKELEEMKDEDNKNLPQ